MRALKYYNSWKYLLWKAELIKTTLRLSDQFKEYASFLPWSWQY